MLFLYLIYAELIFRRMNRLMIMRMGRRNLFICHRTLCTFVRNHNGKQRSHDNRFKVCLRNLHIGNFAKFSVSTRTVPTIRIFSDDENVELFPDSPDECLKKITSIATNESTTGIFDLVNTLHEYEHDATVERSCQSIVTLHHLTKLNRHCKKVMSQIRHDLKLRQILTDSIKLIENEIHIIPGDVLVKVLHSLKRLEFPQRSVLPEKLLEECVQRFPKDDPMSIIYLSTCLNSDDLKNVLHQINLLPILQERLNTCASIDELKWAALCLRNLINVAGDSVQLNFFNKIREFTEENSGLPADVAFACLRTASYSSIDNRDVTTLLLNQLRDSINDLTLYQLGALRITIKRLDTDVNDNRDQISIRALELLELVSHPLDQLEVLNCLDEQSLQKIRTEAIEILNNCYEMVYVPFHGVKLFSIVKNLKHLDTLFLNQLCSDVVKHLNDTSPFFLMSIAKSYVQFLIGFNGYYRNENLENELQQLLLKHLRANYGLPAREITNISAFFITTNKTALPLEVVEKTLAHCHHFAANDILTVSASLKLALRKKIAPGHRLQLLTISQHFDKSIPTFLNSSLSLPDLCQHIAANLNRSKAEDNYLLDDAMDKYNNHLKNFTSKTLIATSKNIAEARYFFPEVIDAMVDYALKNRNITGWAISLLLFACYETSYFPILGEEFLDYSKNILKRDFDQITGLKILQATLAFTLFNQFPSFLASNIFSVAFLERLDKDIQISWSPAYARKVRNYLMNVNRVICLEYPEYKVPWFHEKYCHENYFYPGKNRTFFNEIEQSLVQVLGGTQYLNKNSYTPYHYPLPFECVLDSHNRPLVYDSNGKSNLVSDGKVKRVALNVLRENEYCSNVRHLRGSQHIKRRHLEIMNYKVVEISHFEWNSLYLSDQKSRANLLQKKIFD